MASYSESPQVAFVSGSKHSASPEHPSSSPFRLSRLVLPILCVTIGVPVGFATGFTLALVNAPNEIVAASSNATRVSPAPLTANLSQPATAAVHSVVKSAVANLAVAKAPAQTTVHIALNKMPDAVKPAMFTLGGKQWRVAKPMAIPVA